MRWPRGLALATLASVACCAHAAAWTRTSGPSHARRPVAAASCRPVRTVSMAAADEAPDPEKAAKALMAWLKKRGASIDRVRIEQSEPGTLGWGLRAAAATDAGEVLATVPDACTLATTDDAMAQKALAALEAEVPTAHWPVQLGLRLLVEASDPKSDWAAYCAALPGAFHAIPLFYSDTALRALKSSWLAEHVFEQRELIEAVIGRLEGADAPFRDGPISAADLRWATAIASSRALRADGSDTLADAAEPEGAAGYALVPLLDVCNHESDPTCALERDAAGGAFTLVARRALRAGEPLTVNYGARMGNGARLLRFGFVEAEDEHDFALAPFDDESLDAAHLLGEPKPMASGLHVGGVPEPLSRPPPSVEAVKAGASLEPFQRSRLETLGLVGAAAQPMLRFSAERIDGRLLAALRVLYAHAEDQLEGHGIDALQTDERLLDDSLEEQVRRTALGWAMLVAGGCADPALTAGFGGGIGRTDTHMLVAGRATSTGMLSTNGKTALGLRKSQLRAAIGALRHAKGTLLHRQPIQSAFLDPIERNKRMDEDESTGDGEDDEDEEGGEDAKGDSEGLLLDGTAEPPRDDEFLPPPDSLPGNLFEDMDAAGDVPAGADVVGKAE